MEFDDYMSEPTARQKMQARTVMAENPDYFAVPDECADCEDLNRMLEDIALDKVRFDRTLAEAAQALCFFKDACEGAMRSDDGTWQACGSRIMPVG